MTYASANAGHETDYGVRAEWQVSDTFPLAINGAYHRAEFGGSFGGGSGIDVFTVGLTLHLNGAAPTTLVDTNRTGTLVHDRCDRGRHVFATVFLQLNQRVECVFRVYENFVKSVIHTAS